MRSLRNSSLRERLYKNNAEQNAASSALQQESEKQTCELLQHYSVSRRLNSQTNLNNDILSTWQQNHPPQHKELPSDSVKVRTHFNLKRNIRVKKLRVEKNIMDQSLEYKQRLNEFDARPIFSISLLSPNIVEKEEGGSRRVGQRRLRSKTIKAYLAYSSIPSVQSQASSKGQVEVSRRRNDLGSQMDRAGERASRQVTLLSTLQINSSVSLENFMRSIKQSKFVPKNALRTPSSTQKLGGIFKKSRGQSISLEPRRGEAQVSRCLEVSMEKIVARSPQFKKLQRLLSLEK